MANQSIYAAFERMWQHLSDRLEEYKPEGLATEEYVDSKVENKVDKVVGDISSILDSIIGEEVWTFTLEDGSTVDKVVISSD